MGGPVWHTHSHLFSWGTVPICPKTRSGPPPLSFNIIHCSNLRLQPDYALANQLILHEVPRSHWTPANGRPWVTTDPIYPSISGVTITAQQGPLVTELEKLSRSCLAYHTDKPARSESCPQPPQWPPAWEERRCCSNVLSPGFSW